MHADTIKMIKDYIVFFRKREFDFSPWYFIDDDEINIISAYLSKKYNKRHVFCFAKNASSDDYSCFALNGDLEGKFINIHDFADVGWETFIEDAKESFGEVLEAMVQDAIWLDWRAEI